MAPDGPADLPITYQYRRTDGIGERLTIRRADRPCVTHEIVVETYGDDGWTHTNSTYVSALFCNGELLDGRAQVERGP